MQMQSLSISPCQHYLNQSININHPKFYIRWNNAMMLMRENAMLRVTPIKKKERKNPGEKMQIFFSSFNQVTTWG